jgi:hypothetical protein
MLVFRCTKRVVRHLGLQLVEQPSASTGKLGDWYVNLTDAGIHPWFLCVSERSLLPVLIPAGFDSLYSKFPLILSGVLRALGIEQTLIGQELPQPGEIAFARTRNRQVLGVMNDFSMQVEGYPGALASNSDAIKLSLRVAESPMSPIGYESPGRYVRGLLG